MSWPLMTRMLKAGRPSAASDSDVGQRLSVDQPLADAPVLVEQVREVQDVGTELQGVALAPEVREHVLRNAEVGLVHHGQEHRIAHRVAAPDSLQIVVLLDVSLPGRGLLCRRVGDTAGRVQSGSSSRTCSGGRRSGRCWRCRRSCRPSTCSSRCRSCSLPRKPRRTSRQTRSTPDGSWPSRTRGGPATMRSTRCPGCSGRWKCELPLNELAAILPGIHGVLGFSVAVTTLDPESCAEVLLERAGDVPGCPDVLVLQDDRIRRIRVETVRGPAHPGVGPRERRLARPGDSH